MSVEWESLWEAIKAHDVLAASALAAIILSGAVTAYMRRNRLPPEPDDEDLPETKRSGSEK